MDSTVINLIYLVASVLFILGIRGLTHPRTAVRGNLMGATGMLLAVVATLLDQQIFGAGTEAFLWIAAGVGLGAAIGATLALRIAMTAMPEMVALLNAFGGGASALVAGAVLVSESDPAVQTTVATVASGLIGSVTFWGSLVAFDKLRGLLLPDRPVVFPGQQMLNAILGLVALGCGALVVADAGIGGLSPVGYYAALVGVASVLGILLTIPIGGADMPVAIALLNSYSGLAAASTGFVLSNNILIITGSLVGASGLILTRIMCKAMNRSLVNVLVGAIAEGGGSPKPTPIRYTRGASRARPPKRWRCCSTARAGSSSSRATASRCRRRSTRCVTWPTCSRNAASRWSTPSTRWPAGCRAT